MIRHYYLVKDLTTNELFIMLRFDFKRNHNFYKNVVSGFKNKLFKVVKVY